MFANIFGDIAISVGERDKMQLDAGKDLEYVLEKFVPLKKVTLMVRDNVVRIPGHASEQGWRVETYPANSDFATRREWRIIIDRGQYAMLIQKGYVASRWIGGLRCEITYERQI